jgi:hypothetical protein
MQAADRLVRLGKQALHLATELVGQVKVLLFQDRPAHRGQIILRIEIVTIHRKARPERVFIQLQRFFRRIGGNGTRRMIGLRVLGIIGSIAPPPKTIAPRRPLPMGRASTHWDAGLVYHSFRSPASFAGAWANPKRLASDRVAATVEAVTRKRRRVNLPMRYVLP